MSQANSPHLQLKLIDDTSLHSLRCDQRCAARHWILEYIPSCDTKFCRQTSWLWPIFLILKQFARLWFAPAGMQEAFWTLSVAMYRGHSQPTNYSHQLPCRNWALNSSALPAWNRCLQMVQWYWSPLVPRKQCLDQRSTAPIWEKNLAGKQQVHRDVSKVLVGRNFHKHHIERVVFSNKTHRPCILRHAHNISHNTWVRGMLPISSSVPEFRSFNCRGGTPNLREKNVVVKLSPLKVKVKGKLKNCISDLQQWNSE